MAHEPWPSAPDAKPLNDTALKCQALGRSRGHKSWACARTGDRAISANGRLSDMANLAWAKNSVLDAAVRELEWDLHHKAATDPRKSQENGVVFRRSASPMRKNEYGPAHSRAPAPVCAPGAVTAEQERTGSGTVL
jgi:hypothetical protein